MPRRWIIERFSEGPPDVVDAFGDDAYLRLLTHQDITSPGRIKGIGLEGDGPPVAFELARDEVLVIARRQTVSAGPVAGPSPVWIVLGARGPRGARFLFIAPNGAVLSHWDLNAV